MKEIKVSKDYQGVRLDKVVFKVLKNASKGFIYKMYRKKNITLNRKKISGKEILLEGDCIQFFFSDETFKKFSEDHKQKARPVTKNKLAHDRDEIDEKAGSHKIDLLDPNRILYEDDDLLVYNKEADLLSQSNGRDHHLIEKYEAYMEKKGIVNKVLDSYGVCNRLDRNTTGVILVGRNARSLRAINNTIQKGLIKKLYHALLVGKLEEDLDLKGYHTKKTNRNKVMIKTDGDGDFIHTLVHPIKWSSDGKYTLAEVEIKTGKSHQIRAHLASVGYPLIGDGKYGDKKTNDFFRKHYAIKFQMLHSYAYQLSSINELPALSNKLFIASYSDDFDKLVKELFNE